MSSHAGVMGPASGALLEAARGGPLHSRFAADRIAAGKKGSCGRRLVQACEGACQCQN